MLVGNALLSERSLVSTFGWMSLSEVRKLLRLVATIS